MTSSQTYGESLPDQFERLVTLSEAQIELLADTREIYRERATLDREYAGKLQALAQKAAAKKAKVINQIVVGDEPTKGYNDTTIASSTINAAYSQIIGFVAGSATHHFQLADSLNSQVVEVLRGIERRHEEIKKKQTLYFQKSVAERDRVYGDRAKSKQKYDDECAEVESYRHKQGKAHADKHAERAAKQFEQQEIDMYNAKNLYIISTAVANQVKEKFYQIDLPALENQLQRQQTALIGSLTSIALHASALEDQHLSTQRHALQTVTESLSAVNPAADQDVFIDYNIRPFSAPANFTFEPCGVHYDTPEMNVDPNAKVYLQNKLGKSKSKLRELDAIISTKGSEVESLAIHMEAGDLDNALEKHQDASHELTSFVGSQTILRTEVETILAALDGDEGSQNPHQFKSSSFSIPTTCGYCQTSIWGLSKQGKTCKACGLAVHGKCELKVPADCGGSRGKHGHTSSISGRASISSRPSTISTLSDTTPTPSSFVEPHSSLSTHNDVPMAKVLYAYTATSPFELSVFEGANVMVLEDDDGSGWVKVDDSAGGKGLVPATYLDMSDLEAPPTPATGTGKQYVSGLYEYTPQGPDEISVSVGQTIELTSGPNGGTNYSDAWWEGVGPSGKKGIFPSNYVQLV